MWHALIISLILLPSDPPVPSHAPPEAWQALKDVALAMELVGPHENWATDFNAELRYVRRHYRALRDAPPLADCCWLPASGYAKELCDFNECYQAHLTMQVIIYPSRREPLTDVLNETKRLYMVWDAVRRANTPAESWALRRRMLRTIREAVGEEAYYRGDLPAVAPVGWFVPIWD